MAPQFAQRKYVTQWQSARLKTSAKVNSHSIGVRFSHYVHSLIYNQPDSSAWGGINWRCFGAGDRQNRLQCTVIRFKRSAHIGNNSGFHLVVGAGVALWIHMAGEWHCNQPGVCSALWDLLGLVPFQTGASALAGGCKQRDKYAICNEK